MKKKAISFLMSIFIALSLTPIGVFAEDGEVNDYYSALNIYNEALENERNAKERIDIAQEELQALNRQKAEIEELIELGENYEQYLPEGGMEALFAEIEALQNELAEKQSALAILQNNITKYKNNVKYPGRAFLNSVATVTLNDYIQIAKNNNLEQYVNHDTFKKTYASSLTMTNLNKSLDFMDQCNSLRAKHGIAPLKIHPNLMTGVTVSNAIARITREHTFARIINIGENLAWGYVNPFDGWYTEEKKLWDKYGGSYEGSEYPYTTGHYENILNSSYKTTGFAWSGSTTKSAAQAFQFNLSGSTYTVAEFRTMLNKAPAQFNQQLQNAYTEEQNLINQISNIEIELSRKQAFQNLEENRERLLNKLAEIEEKQAQILQLETAYNEAVIATQAAKELLETFKVPAEVLKISKIYNKTYNGKYQYQTPLIKYNDKVLVKDTDYKLYYSKNKYVGTATVTIQFMGDYEGTIRKTFIIRPKGTYIRSLSAYNRSFTARWSVVSSKYRKSITGYQVRYSRSSKFTSYRTYSTRITTKSSVRIRNLYKNRRYYVKVRTFKKVGSKYYYSTWSKTKSVRTK